MCGNLLWFSGDQEATLNVSTETFQPFAVSINQPNILLSTNIWCRLFICIIDHLCIIIARYSYDGAIVE